MNTGSMPRYRHNRMTRDENQRLRDEINRLKGEQGKPRVNGVNQHCHTVCNPLYTTYVTTDKKDRLAVLEALLNGWPVHHDLWLCGPGRSHRQDPGQERRFADGVAAS